MSGKSIECEAVSFFYDKGEDILKDITFQGQDNEAIGLIGANGVGKSTLLRILVGLEPNYRGKAYVNQIPVIKNNLSEIRLKTGYLFQDSDNQLFTQSVYHDVAFALRNYGMDEKTVDERVRKALESIGILYLKDKKIYKMSGGEKKMASIATILAMDPDIILLDEPSIALDPKNRRKLINTLNQLNYLKLIASHDLDLVLETCDRVILLANGRIVADDSAEVILSNQELLEEHGLELPLCLGGVRKRTKLS